MADITYLGQEEAKQLDEELMGPLGFSVDQVWQRAFWTSICIHNSVCPACTLLPLTSMLLTAGIAADGACGAISCRLPGCRVFFGHTQASAGGCWAREQRWRWPGGGSTPAPLWL